MVEASVATFLRHENETDGGFPFKPGEEVDVQIDAGKATLTVHSIASKKVERGISKNR
jgi:hypothetical protein